MPQEDKIKREIDRIGLVLAKMLSLLLHKPFEHADMMEQVCVQVQSELDINLEDYLKMDEAEAIRYLAINKKFSLEHLRSFGNMLYYLAGTEAGAEQQKLRAATLNLYKYISENGNGTMYLDVALRIKELGQN